MASRREILILDKLDEALLECLKKELLDIGSLLALSSRPSRVHIALCALLEDPLSGTTQVQVLFGPGPYCPRTFQSAVLKLPAGPCWEDETSERQSQGLHQVLKMLDEGRTAAHAGDSVTFVAHTFHACSQMTELLQVAGNQNVHLHFVAFLLDEFCNKSAERSELGKFGGHTSLVSNAGLAVLSSDKWSVRLALLNWLRRVAEPEPAAVFLRLDSFCGSLDSLSCRTASEIYLVGKTAEAAPVCPCHGLPVPGPEASGFQRCPMAGSAIMPKQCRPNSDFKQLGSHFLYLPSSVHRLPTAVRTNTQEQAPVELDVLHSVKASEVSNSLAFGTPTALYPWSEEASDLSTLERNEQCFAAICQALLQRRELLVIQSHIDICDGFKPLPHLVFFLLQPAMDVSSLLARRVACKEEFLPMADLLPILEPAEAPLVDEMSRCLEAVAIQGPLAVEISNAAAGKAQEWISASAAFPNPTNPSTARLTKRTCDEYRPAATALKRSKMQKHPLAVRSVRAAISDDEEPPIVLPPAPKPMPRTRGAKQRRGGARV